MFKLCIQGNYFFIQKNSERPEEYNRSEILIHKVTDTGYKIVNAGRLIISDVIEFDNIIDENDNPFDSQSIFENWYRNNTGFNISQARERILVTQDNYLYVLSNIDSTKEYFLDGIINIGSFQIVVPIGGITLTGYSFDISGLISSEPNYTMFISESEIIGSGNILGTNYFIRVDGSKSKVHNLYDSDGTHAIEYNKVNFINCSSLGDLHNYRQYLETGTGRFGGKCDLFFNGTMNGARISTSIARGTASNVALFREGVSLIFSGRFITDINADLNTLGALFDFSETNFTNDESLIIKGAFVTRNGLIDASDTTIYPNIDNTSVKSLWSDNTGLPNTTKYIKGVVTTEVETIISDPDTYYPLEGTFTIEQNSHFDSPTNGQYRLLSGNGTYQITGDLSIAGTQNNEIDIRITKSTDGGGTFPVEINHIKRIINAFSGSRDVGFFPINFIATLKEGEIIRPEVENKSGTGNVTSEIDSYLIITQI